jgi:hypothetical protein
VRVFEASLEGDWRVKRESGLLPPGLSKRIRNGKGWTRFLGLPLLPFRSVGSVLSYGLLPIRDELVPGARGEWLGRGLLFGREFCRFRLTPA